MTTTKSTRRRRRFATGLAKVAGARQEVLDAAPGGLGRQAAMGAVILTTSVLAAGSAAFALHMALNSPVWMSALLGLGWGVVILNIDRMLVLGMGHERSVTRNLMMAVPRVFLAFILGVVISTPLTLQIFDKEIQAELLVQQNNRQAGFDKQLAGLTAAITATQARIAQDDAVITGGAQIDPSTDPRVKAAQASDDAALAYFTAQQNEYLPLARLAQCEYNGTCGTHKVGDGPQYRAAKALADQQAVLVQQAKTALANANKELRRAQGAAERAAQSDTKQKVKNASDDEASAKKTLAQQTSDKSRLESVFGNANQHDTGLLSRLEALDELGRAHGTLRLAQITLALLFLTIEILPMLMKLLLNIGKETTFERVSRETDEEDFEAYEKERKLRVSEQQAEIDAAKIRHSLIVTNEQQRVIGQEQVLEIINEAVIKKQKEVVLGALQIWAEHASRESERILHQYNAQFSGVRTPIQPTPLPPPAQNPMWNPSPGPRIEPGPNGHSGMPHPSPEPIPNHALRFNQFLNDMDLPAPEHP